MSDLPSDLVEEILSRVPAKALSRFRSTCKRWNALFRDKRFTKKHNDRAAKQFLVLKLNKHRVSSLSLNLHGIDNENTVAPCIEFKGEFSLKDSPFSFSSGQDILNVFHCDGLLLCQTRKNRLVVWNPCTGETRSIIPSNHCCEDSMFALGYVNNKSSSRNFKLLRYRIYCYYVIEFEIYEFSTGSWRIVNVTTAHFNLKTSGLSLKGNTYWITDGDYILCFHFSTERLRRLFLPFKTLHNCITPLTTIREEQLSVLHHSFDSSKMEIWVTTNDKIDHTLVLSWRKLFVINQYSFFRRPLVPYCVSFVIEKEKKVVVCYNSVHIDKTIRTKLCVIGENGVYTEK